jgi:hypothetical protein
MHLEEREFLKHYGDCNDIGHFEKPLVQREYGKLMKNNFREYKKGSLPDWFKVNEEALKLAIKRYFNKEYKCNCELLKLINNILKLI